LGREPDPVGPDEVLTRANVRQFFARRYERWVPPRSRLFFGRQTVVPFECLIGALAFVSGLFHLFGIGSVGQDPLTLLLPDWLAFSTDVSYAIAGLAILFGVGLSRGDIEAFGIILVATGIVVRSIALIDLAGFTESVRVAVLFNVMILFTCCVRVWMIVRGQGSLFRTRTRQ
jgi:hypothetical protein